MEGGKRREREGGSAVWAVDADSNLCSVMVWG